MTITAVAVALVLAAIAYIFFIRPSDLPAGEGESPLHHLEERKARRAAVLSGLWKRAMGEKEPGDFVMPNSQPRLSRLTNSSHTLRTSPSHQPRSTSSHMVRKAFCTG